MAIRNGSNSSYGGPSYDVYVHNRRQKKFVMSQELTQLASTGLGMFVVDKNKKRLISCDKIGRCWHEMTHYAIHPKNGIYVTYSKEEAVTADRKIVEVTILTLIGKK